MNNHDTPSLDGLPQWATITQVSQTLLVPRTTVRAAVRRALAEGEPWVKREDEGDEYSPYLIDTTHPTYRSHVERWTQKQEDEEPDRLENEWPPTTPSFFTRPYAASPSAFSTSLAPKSGEEVLQLWPHFRDQLYFWGVQIFQNILAAPIDDWQWRWGELHGEGYESEETAIVAALHSRLAPPEDQSPLPPAAPLCPPPTRRASAETIQDHPHWFFPRRKRRFF